MEELVSAILSSLAGFPVLQYTVAGILAVGSVVAYLKGWRSKMADDENPHEEARRLFHGMVTDQRDELILEMHKQNTTTLSDHGQSLQRIEVMLQQILYKRRSTRRDD